MVKEELLLKEGAFYAGHRLLYKHQDIGVNMDGTTLVLTPEGEEIYARLSNITDVEVKPVRAKRKMLADGSIEPLGEILDQA